MAICVMKDAKKRRHAVILGAARNIILRLNLQTPARFLRRLLRLKGVLAIEKEQHAARLPDLDCQTARAWVPSSSGFLAGYTDIFLTDSLSEEEIDKLLTALRDIHDPDTGEALVIDVYREDVYGKGEFAPPERHIIVLASERTTLPTELGQSVLWETSVVTSGIHHPGGVLYLFGGGVKQGQRIAPAHVDDAVPTILTRLGVPLPEDLDGHYLEQAFTAPLPSPSGEDRVVLRKLNMLAGRSN